MKAFLAVSLAMTGMALGASCASAQVSPEPFESRYTLLDDCLAVAEGAPGYDWALLQCEGYDGIPIWWRYADSTRLYVGFGERPNDSGWFGRSRNSEWPIEWRGRFADGKFVPHAVILRMSRAEFDDADVPENFLAVYALREDGTSCILARDLLDNERARSVADSASEAVCQSEPYLYEGLFETALEAYHGP